MSTVNELPPAESRRAVVAWKLGNKAASAVREGLAVIKQREKDAARIGLCRKCGEPCFDGRVDERASAVSADLAGVKAAESGWPKNRKLMPEPDPLEPEIARMAAKTRAGQKKGRNGGRTAGNRPFLALLASMGLPAPVAEHRFHPTRKWRMDYAWPTQRVALEVDGGLFVNGGHNRGAQMKLTMEKENAAATMGWRFLKCEPRDLCKRETLEAIKAALAFQLF